MTNLTIGIYRYFKNHKAMMYVAMLLSFAIFALIGSRMEYEEDISKLLPGVDPSKSEGLVFSQLQIKDRIFVQFVANNDTTPTEELFEACDEFADSLLEHDAADNDVRDLFYRIDDEMIMNAATFAVENVPIFIDEAYYTVIDSMLGKENIERQMDENLELIMSGDELAYSYLVPYDPVGFRNLAINALGKGGNSGAGSFTLVDRHLASPDSTVAIALLTPNFVAFDSKTGTRLANKIEAEIEALRLSHPGVDVLFHGAPIQSVFNSRQIKSDLLLTMGLSLLLICVTLLLCMRNKTTLPMLIAPIVYGIAFALTFVYLIQGRMSLMALGIGAIVLGVALSYCLHVITHYKYVSDPERVLREQTRPVLLGTLTTIGAFVGLLLTKSPLLRDFGMFASLGMVGTTLFCLVFLPQFFNPERNRKSARAFSVLEKFNSVEFERFGWFIGLIAILFAVCIVMSRQVTFDSDLKNIGYFEPKVVRSNQLYAEKTNNGFSTTYYAVTSGSLDTALLYNRTLARVCDSLAATGDIRGYSKASNLLLPYAEQQQRIDCWNRYWTDERKESVKSLIANAGQKRGIKPEMFQPFFDMIDADYQPASIYEAEALPNGLISSLVEKVGDSYMVFTQVKAPAENVARNNDLLTQLPHTVVVDPFYYTGNMVKLLNNDFNLVLGISSLFVFVVLLLSFRRLTLAAIAFLPMAMSWYITLGVMGICGLQFNLINIVISTFIFGIGVDYSIFIMDGLINRARGNESNLLMFHKTAIVFSAFVLIVGIASLIFATHPAISSIGFATLVGMTSTVVITYTVQPFLFNLLMKTKYGKKIVER